MPTSEIATTKAGDIIEQVIIKGDLSRLTPDESVRYYKAVCESVGLNPLTRPFEYLTLNGKRILYTRKDATDQLRQLHGLSVEVVSRSVDGDLAMVHVRARDKTGRTDEDFGAVNIAGLRGEARANGLMKAITKAKRRVTLSISGLGFLDETEVDDIERRDITPAAPVDTAADLDAFAAASPELMDQTEAEGLLYEAKAEAQRGTQAFRDFWTGLNTPKRDLLRPALSHYQAVAATADATRLVDEERARDEDPFGLPPLPDEPTKETKEVSEQTVSEAPAVPFIAAVRALVPVAGHDGEVNWLAWSEAFIGLIRQASPADCEKLRISSLPQFGRCRAENGDAARAVLDALAARAKEAQQQ